MQNTGSQLNDMKWKYKTALNPLEIPKRVIGI